MKRKALRLPLSQETVHIILGVHDVFKSVPKTVMWLNTRNLNFGGIKPIWLMQNGRGYKVLEFINTAGE